jgi:hypothetical protein
VVLRSFGDQVDIVMVIPAILNHLSLFVPTIVKIGPPTGLSLSFGIRFQVSTIGSITISSINYLCFFVQYLVCSLFQTHTPRKKPQKETKPLCTTAGLVLFASFVVAHDTHLHIVTFISTVVLCS